ncbi:MAG: hypothetical protein LQ341_006138 [Variospora aurantia]|nr:MAG: hypothetical protein LQ341_006138 [Variospora aurantia]
MFHTIALALAVLSLYLGNIIAAPAARPPMARDNSPSRVASLPPTSTTPDAVSSTITPLAGEKRHAQAEGNIHNLEGLVFPQTIKSSPTSSVSSSSSSSSFSVIGTKATGSPVAPVKLAARQLEPEPTGPRTDQQSSRFGALAELGRPLAQSSSVSASATPTPSLGFLLTAGNRVVNLSD